MSKIEKPSSSRALRVTEATLKDHRADLAEVMRLVQRWLLRSGVITTEVRSDWTLDDLTRHGAQASLYLAGHDACVVTAATSVCGTMGYVTGDIENVVRAFAPIVKASKAGLAAVNANEGWIKRCADGLLAMTRMEALWGDEKDLATIGRRMKGGLEAMSQIATLTNALEDFIHAVAGARHPAVALYKPLGAGPIAHFALELYRLGMNNPQIADALDYLPAESSKTTPLGVKDKRQAAIERTKELLKNARKATGLGGRSKKNRPSPEACRHVLFSMNVHANSAAPFDPGSSHPLPSTDRKRSSLDSERSASEHSPRKAATGATGRSRSLPVA